MLTLQVKLVTPEKAVLEMEAISATLPIQDGEVTILPKHEAYIGALSAGEILVRKKGDDPVSLAVSGGFIEFDNDILTILADTAERAEEIDEARAEEARKRAEDLKKQAVTMNDEEYARVAAMLEKEMTRIKVAKKHRGRLGPHITSE